MADSTAPAPARALALLTALVVASALLVAAAPPARSAPARTALELHAEQRFHALHNDARRNPAAFGIGDHGAARAMAVAADVREVARAWSDHMQATRVFQHNPSYSRQYCCWRATAENIVYRSSSRTVTTLAEVDQYVDDLFRLWVGSSGHRRNLMNGRWHDFGVGVSLRGGTMYVTANFRERDGTPPPPQPADAFPPVRAPAAVVDDTSNPNVRRVAGSDRIRTAVAVTLQAFPSAPTVVLARADAYSDALAAAPLAGARQAPLLLVGRSAPVDSAVVDALRRLGTREVLVLGGQSAIGDGVLADLRARTGVTAQRITGEDRWTTAARAALAAVPTGASVSRVFVVEGANRDPARGWPDALSVSAVAARTGAPVLLASRDALPVATASALRELRPSQVVVVGGTGAVSDAVLRAIGSTLPGARVERWAGSDRFATSVLVNERAGVTSNGVVVVTGLSYADALAAGAAAARQGRALLLTHGRAPTAAQTVYDRIARAHRGQAALVVGGQGAIIPEVHNRVVRAVAGSAS